LQHVLSPSLSLSLSLLNSRLRICFVWMTWVHIVVFRASVLKLVRTNEI
jgi:hypothetical protein